MRPERIKMKSEQIKYATEKFIANGGKISVLPADNRVFYFPVDDVSPAEKLLDKFSCNLFEEDERFFDILD